jgi:Zn-dependent membrane protease YugP
MPFFIDPVYFWYVFIPALLISLGVQVYLQATFRRWGQVKNGAHLNGIQVGRRIFERTPLEAVPLERAPGALSDHFDPLHNVVRLSDPVASRDSVVAIAVTAHELGHVQQYQAGSALIKMRGFLLPAIQFSPTISYLALMFGLIFEMNGLIWIGVFFFALLVLFSILTLPVELDASRRALSLLQEAGLATSHSDARGVRQVLNAAALTYLAAAITSILQLLYYVSLARRQ